MREPLLRGVAFVAPDAAGTPALLAHASLCGDGDATHYPLGSFCFPEHSAWQRVQKATSLDTAYHCFVLTNGAGERTFGHAVRFLPAGEGARFPAVLCALSQHYWPALFRDLLCAMLPLAGDLTDAALLGPACAIRQKLEEICALALPQDVELPLIATGPLNTDDEAIATLLQRVPPATVCTLLCSLLRERRVVITGAALSDVSAAVHACGALLRPLAWQHLFLPVLPAGMLEYVSAPMPFLIGLQASAFDAMQRMKLPVEHLVVLDCDTGIIDGAAYDVEELPAALLSKLQTSLEQGAGAAAVSLLMSRLLGSYKEHIHSIRGNAALPDGALRADARFFDHAAWAGQSRSLARFRNALRHSQHFEAFICDQMASVHPPPPARFSGSVETASSRMADMLSRSGYRSLRDADCENSGPRAAAGRGWLLPRRPLAPSNMQTGTVVPPVEAKAKAVVPVDAEKNRALVEAAVACWQRHVSLPLREAAQTAVPVAQHRQCEGDKPQPAGDVESTFQYEAMEPAGEAASAYQYEAMVLRSERDLAVAQRDSLLRERDELLAILSDALNPLDARDTVAPAVAALLAPLQARLVAVTTERDLLAAERDALRSRAACKR